MSEQETYIGKFKKVSSNPEEFAKTYLTIVENLSSEEATLETLLDRYSRFFVANGILYELVTLQELEDPDQTIFNKESENVWSFYTSFYNGGTCLEEQLENFKE